MLERKSKMKSLILFKQLLKSDYIVKKLIVLKLLKKIGIDNLLRVIYYNKPTDKLSIRKIINIDEIDISECKNEVLTYLCSMYTKHYFNILGSGWVSAAYDSIPLGLENITFKTNTNIHFDKKKKRIEIDSEYNRIDWHKDIKTGYRFDNSILSYKIRKNVPPGVDIKMPWELSRMYHLPQMALYALISSVNRESIINEFRNQLIDFMQTNRAGYGVNYCSPLEVAIRSVNILTSFDIIRQVDSKGILCKEFEVLLAKDIIRHGRVIVSNLEMSLLNKKNGNHYLGSLCGLIFIGAYIKTKETSRWFKFAAKELLKEIDKQFGEDGGLRECSTAYHRFCAEMVYYTVAILIHEQFNFDEKILTKLQKIANFTILIRNNSGNIIQIGDNDSGRFLKFLPRGKFISIDEVEKLNTNLKNYLEIYKNQISLFVENELLTDYIIAYASAYFKNPIFDKYIKGYAFECSIIKAIMGKYKIPEYKMQNSPECSKLNSSIDISGLSYFCETNIKLTNLIIENVKVESATEFGLHIFTAKEFKLFVRSSPKCVNELLTAHAHSDIFHYEINIKGNSYFSDCGSYVYTSIPEKRNLFRKACMHNVPIYNEEPFDFLGVFQVIPKIKTQILVQNDNELGIYVEFGEIKHYRHFTVTYNSIIVKDYGSKEFKYVPNNVQFFSDGYGIIRERASEFNDLIISVRKYY